MTTSDPDGYIVERSIEIEADPATVYDLIHHLGQWRKWSPWEGLDDNLTRTYDGPEAGIGARYEWSGNRKAGAGSMTVSEAVLNRLVGIDLRFTRPFKSTSYTRLRLDPIEAARPGIEATRVTWTLTGANTRLLKLLGAFLSMEKMVGPDFEKGLANLKVVAETSDLL